MLNSNKTYDNRNLRDRQKVFNDGKVVFYNTEERKLLSEKATFYYSRESVSFQSYTQAEQNSNTAVIAIGIMAQGAVIEAGDIAKIENEYYMVDHVQYKNYERPEWYKVYLERTTMPYETV